MSEKEKIQIEVELSSKSLSIEHAVCPNNHSLSDKSVKINGKPSFKVKVKYKEQEGFMYLDPVYGSYENIEEGISLPRDAVAEFFCPECGVSLSDAEDRCQSCSSPMFVFHLPKGSIVEGCLKKGCTFHSMKIVDGERQIARLFENSTIESFL